MSCKYFFRDPSSCKFGEACRYSHNIVPQNVDKGLARNRRRSRSKSKSPSRRRNSTQDTVLTDKGWFLLPGASTVISSLRANGVSVLILSKCRQKMACRSLQVVSKVTESKQSLLHEWLDGDDLTLFTLFCVSRSEKALLLKRIRRDVLACLDDHIECMDTIKSSGEEHLKNARLMLVNANSHEQKAVMAATNSPIEVRQTWWDVAKELGLMKYADQPLLSAKQLIDIKAAYDDEVKCYLSTSFTPNEPNKGDIDAVEKLFMRGFEEGKEDDNMNAYVRHISDSKYRHLFTEREPGEVDTDHFPVIMVDIGNVIVTSEPVKPSIITNSSKFKNSYM